MAKELLQDLKWDFRSIGCAMIAIVSLIGSDIVKSEWIKTTLLVWFIVCMLLSLIAAIAALIDYD